MQCLIKVYHSRLPVLASKTPLPQTPQPQTNRSSLAPSVHVETPVRGEELVRSGSKGDLASVKKAAFVEVI